MRYARQLGLVHVLPQDLPVLIAGEKIGHLLQGGPVLLGDQLPGVLQSVDGSAL